MVLGISQCSPLRYFFNFFSGADVTCPRVRSLVLDIGQELEKVEDRGIRCTAEPLSSTPDEMA